MYSTEEKRIIINDKSDFNIKHILDCGQVFRYALTDGGYRVFSGKESCFVTFDSIIETDNVPYFINYFDLHRDYGEIKRQLAEKGVEKDALEFGYGIRLLNQEPFETIISFIISANNNIPRIKGIIERICSALGEEKDGYFAFPTPERFATADESFFKSIGAGYRAPYLVKTGKMLLDADFDGIKSMKDADARTALCRFYGVGNKVADCILLFAFKKTAVFPIDTWTKKVYNSINYMPQTANLSAMSENLNAVFGNLSGYAQQYLYYYYRENY